MQTELILTTAEINLPHEIANLEQLKADLIPRLEKYSNLVVTSDSIKSAKDDKATLNRLKKVIDEQRKQIKKAYLEPYQILENQCKEIIGLIDAPIQAIDEQLKAFDEAEKEQKLGALKTAFFKTTRPEWLKFETVLPQKWANKTEKSEKLIGEITAECERISAEYSEISEMYADAPFLVAVQEQYKQSCDKSETLAYAVTLERQYQAHEKSTPPESVENAPVCISESGNTNTPVTSQTAVSDISEAPDRIVQSAFMVQGTITQLKSLAQYMIDNGIQFHAIKNNNNQ